MKFACRATGALAIAALLFALPSVSVAATKSIAAAQSATRSVGPAGSKAIRLVVKKLPAGVAAMQSSATGSSAAYEVITVPEEDADATAALLRQQDGVLAVERDLPTAVPQPLPSTPVDMSTMFYTRSASVAGIPNDTWYLQQHHWQAQTDTYRGQSAFEAAYLRADRNHEVNIAVLDSGFTNHPELSWAGGYNFTTDGTAEGAYLDYDAQDCKAFHGQVVGSIIGAETNNAQSIAGMVDANLYAVRVLNCDGVGSLMEAATGIRYAAGDTTLGVPAIGVQMDVINLSLGASGGCPGYMQDAINFARSRGIAVVVAAGNAAIDAGDFTPANCQGVITVGAVDRWGDQASFSNFGAAVDISLLGVDVVAPDPNGGDAYYAGTSFSTPIAAGMVAHLRQQQRTITPDQAESMLKAATTALGITTAPMGAGITNGGKLQQLYEGTVIGRGSSLKHVLDADDRCDDALYLDHYQALFDVCSLYEVSVSELPLTAGKHYVLFAVPHGSELKATAGTVVGAGQDVRFIVPNIDSSLYQYGLQVCADDGSACERDTLVDLDTSGLARPASCDGDGGLASLSRSIPGIEELTRSPPGIDRA